MLGDEFEILDISRLRETYNRLIANSQPLFTSAVDLSEDFKFITTGSNNLDKLLMGGIETKAITEFYGPFGSGKTQLCHQLAVTVQLPTDAGGLDRGAIYIDTERTFRRSRIVAIAENLGLEPKTVLANIHVASIYTVNHLIYVINKLADIVPEKMPGLIIVDSAIAPFRTEFVGRERLATRQQIINIMLHILLHLSVNYDLATVITNQVVARPTETYGGPDYEPIGGHIVGHNSTYRIWLRKSKKNLRIATIVDSPKHPPGEAVFAIANEGIKDPEV